MTVSKSWCNLEIGTNKPKDLNFAFANHREEDEIYSLTTLEIAEAQRKDRELKIYYKKNARRVVLPITLTYSVALSRYSHRFYHFQSTSFFLHQILKTTFTLPQNLLAFFHPVQKHFLSTSLSKICIFFCLSILNVIFLYLTSNYFTFCLPPLVLPHLFFD